MESTHWTKRGLGQLGLLSAWLLQMTGHCATASLSLLVFPTLVSKPQQSKEATSTATAHQRHKCTGGMTQNWHSQTHWTMLPVGPFGFHYPAGKGSGWSGFIGYGSMKINR